MDLIALRHSVTCRYRGVSSRRECCDSYGDRAHIERKVYRQSPIIESRRKNCVD